MFEYNNSSQLSMHDDPPKATKNMLINGNSKLKTVLVKLWSNFDYSKSTFD